MHIISFCILLDISTVLCTDINNPLLILTSFKKVILLQNSIYVQSFVKYDIKNDKLDIFIMEK